MKFSLVLAAGLAAATVAHAAPQTLTTTLSGAAESPANASPGTGIGKVIFDSAAHSLIVSETFSGLSSPTTASHIHCCTTLPGVGNAGVATMTPTFSGFPTGVTSGTFSQTFDTTLASTYNPAFVSLFAGSLSAAESALFAGLQLGETYLNIHTTAFGGGEIRGFLVLAPVPEPETFALMLAGLGALGLARRRAAGVLTKAKARGASAA
ncbi:MAG: CHRD domain-containing protein [Pseudomonadota bacterium]|nr:CHRD domain-containing protein [Pseudomonadota bacterium]